MDTYKSLLMLNSKMGHYEVENSSWSTEYSFKLIDYGHYLLVANKGSGANVAVVFNYGSGPQLFWITSAPPTITFSTSKNILNAKSSDSTTFYATCINISAVN